MNDPNNPLLLLVVCPALGCAIAAGVLAIGAAASWLPRYLLIDRRRRSAALRG